jgi:CheY-like chemotaxis protein
MSVSILVIDDEADVVLLFRQCFRHELREGTYVMHFANSGEDALELLGERFDPQLIAVLSDINMLGMDGLTFLGKIKQRFPDLPVMMVTAYDDNERKRQARDLGAAQFLAKPVDFNHLRAQLRLLADAAD